MRRLFWALQAGESELGQKEEEYYTSVKEWNFNFWKSRSKIRLLSGEERADEFLDYRDDGLGNSPNSLHYKFVIAHRMLIRYKSDRSCELEVEDFIRRLGWDCSVFMERFTTEFVTQSQNVRLLKIGLSRRGADVASSNRDKEAV